MARGRGEIPTPAVRETSARELAQVLDCWGLRLARVRSDLDLAGSPERSEFRTAIEDENGTVFVLERIPEAKCDHRRRINMVLLLLERRGVPAIHPYRLTARESSIADIAGGHWQLMPFIAGLTLPRPGYVFDEWRGRVLGEFLIALRRASDELPGVPQVEFSIRDYVRNLIGRLRKTRPAIVADTREVLAFLERGLMAVHDELPVAFCHGDYHPLNVIWGADRLNTVLDWEFMGYKPELFDLANMVGCAGMERPDALLGELVLAMVRTMRAAGILAPASCEWLVDYILALRFAWMREWVVRHDAKMIGLEIEFMHLLMDNRELLRQRWGLT